jgi:hypothetical protein
MIHKIRPLRATTLTAVVTLGLVGCGGGNSSDMGQMKLAVADAPIDGAQAVVVKFTGIELTADSGPGALGAVLLEPNGLSIRWAWGGLHTRPSGARVTDCPRRHF